MHNNPYEVGSAQLITAANAGGVSEKTLKHIRNAWVAACISGTLTLVIVVLAMNGTALMGFSAWQMIDVVLIFGLAYGIYKKSRICAVVMLLYFIASKIILIAHSGVAGAGGGFWGLVFLYYYGYGVVGTFAYHKEIRNV